MSNYTAWLRRILPGLFPCVTFDADGVVAYYFDPRPREYIVVTFIVESPSK